MTAIEWTDQSWNPVTGCSKVSEGCRNCYAEKVSHRFKWTTKPWNDRHADGNVKMHPERLGHPLRIKKPKLIFVNSMSDLFHPVVTDDFIMQVWETMAAAEQHTFQILTKRPERMRDWVSKYGNVAGTEQPALKNVWLGVSVENQSAADERIPLLLQTPAAVRFLSCEPLLGPVKIPEVFMRKLDWGEGQREWLDGAGVIDWIIVGGESGPNARPMHLEWARSLRDQCQAAGVSFFFKQWGEWHPLPWKEKSNEGKALYFTDLDWTFLKLGKKNSGRLLDGREWNEFPIKINRSVDHYEF